MGRKRTAAAKAKKPNEISAKIVGEIARALDAYMLEKPGNDYASFIRTAVREKLEREGFWPLAPQTKETST